MIRAKKFELQKKMVWESIEASLPTQVGTLDIRDFCASEVLHYINHFEDFCGRKTTKQLANPQGSLLMMMNGLLLPKVILDRGISVPAGITDLYHVGSMALINELFSVSKDEFVGSVELCRFKCHHPTTRS